MQKFAMAWKRFWSRETLGPVAGPPGNTPQKLNLWQEIIATEHLPSPEQATSRRYRAPSRLAWLLRREELPDRTGDSQPARGSLLGMLVSRESLPRLKDNPGSPGNGSKPQSE